MENIITSCEAISRALGRGVSWLALVMVTMCFYTVISRYLFASGMPWQQELVRYCHALLFLLASAYCLQEDRHVRVDVLYQHFSARGQAIVNLLWVLVFLWPMSAAILWFCWDYVLQSWALYEGSNEYGGLPGVFLLKSAMWLFALSLMVQGLGTLTRAWRTVCGAGGE